MSYNQSSVLQFEDRTILPHDGPHQGDPSGLLLFCLSIQSQLVSGFMDDLTLDGPTDVVTADIDLIRDGQKTLLACISLQLSVK